MSLDSNFTLYHTFFDILCKNITLIYENNLGVLSMIQLSGSDSVTSTSPCCKASALWHFPKRWSVRQVSSPEWSRLDLPDRNRPGTTLPLSTPGASHAFKSAHTFGHIWIWMVTSRFNISCLRHSPQRHYRFMKTTREYWVWSNCPVVIPSLPLVLAVEQVRFDISQSCCQYLKCLLLDEVDLICRTEIVEGRSCHCHRQGPLMPSRPHSHLVMFEFLWWLHTLTYLL